MTDRETVAEGLKCRAENRLTKDCEHCHYGWALGRRWGCDFVKLCSDALALLKAQEPEALDMPKPDSDIGCWYDITNNYTLEQVVSALKAQEPREETPWE